MFRKFKQNLIFMYTLSTGLILTFIVVLAFLFSFSSQENRRQSSFQNLLFTLTSKLQTDSNFADSYLAQMELSNKLIIQIEENGSALFFPGSYKKGDSRQYLLGLAENEAQKEGIYEDSHPISSNILQSSIFNLRGKNQEQWRGNVLVIRADSGYKKMTLLIDESVDKKHTVRTGLLYLMMDLIGVFFLYLTGRVFVRRAVRPLQETYQKQQDFVASASHELRSPLAVIEANAAAIADAPSQIPRLLSVIRRECERGNSLIKNLLLLASAESKDFMPRKQSLEIDDLLLHLLEIYEPAFHAKKGSLLLQLPDETLPAVKADEKLSFQILTVLLDNACTYGLEGNPDKKVLLKAGRTGQNVTVSVIDYGTGIPASEKQRIFERFYRSDRSRNDKEHFGLGLSIAAEFARVQKLELDVNDTEGGGSTFTLNFPV